MFLGFEVPSYEQVFSNEMDMLIQPSHYSHDQCVWRRILKLGDHLV
jgi:hypothetical protein